MSSASTVHLVYLARLREALGASSEDFALAPGVRTVAALREALVARGGAWAHELDNVRAVRVAVNHAVAGPDTPITAGCEVAFFPPVTGG